MFQGYVGKFLDCFFFNAQKTLGSFEVLEGFFLWGAVRNRNMNFGRVSHPRVHIFLMSQRKK